MPGGPARRGRYHHGDLAASLVDAGLAHLAEDGVAGFSVSRIARRVGVSTAAPYRHFADRDRFLAAVVTRAADALAEGIARALVAAGTDPGERLAAAAGAYAEVVRADRVGFDVIFAPDLRALHDEELARAGRHVMDLLVAPALELAGPDGALPLVEQVVVLAHGYATLDAGGFLSADRVTEAPTAERARRAAAALIAGALPG
ncbi:TetR/AcrR family transcriptional regulator [Actinomycetospora sp. TBRC 11914]|uniref:TetR/AcrR family transcriptional regulator n=1 Tax=Actinomycetospora sp. TBRC 11914 TaxID=2729387 RepID=UPI00145E58CA|nr:TetR/AcrR family transcriptional regulator [Actinomycetospora sp. TBRC 11914]NMO93729.1 TetR/AcrR family transcriptional regulator [Actinomycetospora sp. TBRC 11914]